MGKRVDAALKAASAGMPPLGFSDEEWYEAKADALMKLAEELEAELDVRADVDGRICAKYAEELL